MSITRNQKQSILFTYIGYIGLFFSVIATLFIYPLDFESYGVLQFLISTGYLLMPFATLGIASTIIKFQPEFHKLNKVPELLGFSFIIILISTVFFVTIYLIFKNPILAKLETLGFDILLLQRMELSILLITFSLGVSNLLTNFSAIYLKIAVPAIINDFTFKIGIASLVLYAAYNAISDKRLGILFTLFCILILFFNLVYLRILGKLKIKFPSASIKDRMSSLLNYTGYTVFGGIGYLLVYRLDLFMITMLLGATEVGYYGILLFMASVIEVPGKGIFKLYAPQISSLFENNKTQKVEHLYKKTSSILMLVAGLLLVLVLSSIHPFLSLMKNGDILLQSVNVWLIIVIAKWIDQFTGINSAIINYSPYYRFNILFIFLQGALNVVLNYYFINQYGLIGAAFATLFSVVIFNFTKSLFIYIIFTLSPFEKIQIYICILLVCLTLVNFILPYSGVNILDLILRPSLISIIAVACIYKFKLSEELINYMNSRLVILRRYING